MTPKEYEHVPKFGGKQEVEEEDEDFYDFESDEKEQKRTKKENEGRPLQISDLRYLKLKVQEVRLTNQELLTNLNLQNDEFSIEMTIPLPDP